MQYAIFLVRSIAATQDEFFIGSPKQSSHFLHLAIGTMDIHHHFQALQTQPTSL